MKTKENPIPGKMKAIRQHQAGGPLRYEEIDVPRPGPGEVLVKMYAAPVNPSDLALLTGGYLERSYPFTPGLEGSGTVVAAGKGVFPRLRLGSRVACSPKHGGDGTWAEYMRTPAMNVAPLPKQLSGEQGAMMVVNPMTAMAFMHLVKEGKHPALVNNAAASSLGKMLIRLTSSRGIPLINIVRKDEHVNDLKEMGAAHVLNSTSPAFKEELTALVHKLNATLFLDAVAGTQSAVLLDAAPKGSTLLCYARLSGETLEAHPHALIVEDKRIKGFQLGNWLQTKGLLFKLRFISNVKKHMDAELSSHISRTYPLQEAGEAIARYKARMSDGKILLKIGS
jgi:NADPH:quinone reductase-like Zn-dependent oxidoreductase